MDQLLPAHVAKTASIENCKRSTIEYVTKSIKKAVDNGKTAVTVVVPAHQKTVVAEIKDILLKNGYTLESPASGLLIIMWG
jgi:bisphosphoglycerate-dependent phosphoglycerate mutase